MEGRAGKHTKYVALTNKIVDPKTDQDLVYLDSNLNEVKEEDSAWILGWHNGDTFENPEKVFNNKTTLFKAENITTKNEKGYAKIIPEVMKELMAGDWVVSSYKSGDKIKQFATLIERIEGGEIYTLQKDFSTTKVNVNKIYAIRTSARNDKFSGFKRSKNLAKLITTFI